MDLPIFIQGLTFITRIYIWIYKCIKIYKYILRYAYTYIYLRFTYFHCKSIFTKRRRDRKIPKYPGLELDWPPAGLPKLLAILCFPLHWAHCLFAFLIYLFSLDCHSVFGCWEFFMLTSVSLWHTSFIFECLILALWSISICLTFLTFFSP